MLSYQHGYHAGCFADVIKHLALSRLLTYMTVKEKPLLYLETHAGKGMYDLYHKQSLTTGEFKQGIELIWTNKKQLPEVYTDYINAIKQCNTNEELRYYPGSPAFAIKALRKIDRLFLCELHPREFEALDTLPHEFKKVHTSNTNGLDSLKSLLPPPEKRGLIFIDPSFEIKDEYKSVPSAIKQAYNRFATGVYCLWYPIVNRRLSDQLIRGMQAINAASNLNVEFYLSGTPSEGMYGCGLWIINPPFTLANELKIALDAFKKIVNPGVSSFEIRT
ncbi:MAG: 23S rRNA (adenine(2030)-N(6))-methyltransferase RlmJ [Legionella sp.]